MKAPMLVIDDDPAILELVTEILVDEGYTVQTAINGAEGLAAIEQARPALVLLDMRMPVLDGWGLAQALSERGISVPIVVMTAAQDAARWSREVGAVAALPKPFDVTELLAAVERALPQG